MLSGAVVNGMNYNVVLGNLVLELRQKRDTIKTIGLITLLSVEWGSVIMYRIPYTQSSLMQLRSVTSGTYCLVPIYLQKKISVILLFICKV